MSKPPYYLATSYYFQNNPDSIKLKKVVGEEELLYHRVEDKEYPQKEYLSLIDSKRFDESKGLSVNRSEYSYSADDVLWIGELDESEVCQYHFQSGFKIIFCQVRDLQKVNDVFPVTIICKYAPLDCNIAHANLITNLSLKDSLSRNQRRDFRMKLSSIFVEYSG